MLRKISEIAYRWGRNNNLSRLYEQFEKDMEYLLSVINEIETELSFYGRSEHYKSLIQEDQGQRARKILSKLNSPF